MEGRLKQDHRRQEVHARHILVETEDEPRRGLAEELKKGADFRAPTRRGGNRRNPAPPMAAISALHQGPDGGGILQRRLALEPGNISTIGKSQFGWTHLRFRGKRRNRKAPEFARSRRQIETYVTRKAQADYVTKLRRGAKVEALDKPKRTCGQAGTPSPKAASPTDAKPAETKRRRRRSKNSHPVFEADSIHTVMAGFVPAILRLDVSSASKAGWPPDKPAMTIRFSEFNTCHSLQAGRAKRATAAVRAPRGGECRQRGGLPGLGLVATECDGVGRAPWL